VFNLKQSQQPSKSKCTCSLAALAFGVSAWMPVWALEAPAPAAAQALAPAATPAPVPATAQVVVPTPIPSAATTKAPAKPEAPFPLGSKFSRTIQRVTGVNLITGVVASEVAKQVLQHKLGGKVKVKVRTYSLTDTLAGKVKSVSIQTSGCNLKDVPLGQVAIKSENPIWYDYHRRNGHRPGLNLPVAMTVQAQVDQDQVGKALSTEAVSKSLRGLKLDLPGLGEQQLQILNPKVQLTGDSVKIDATLVTLGASPDTGVAIVISAKPVLQGSKIMLENMQVSSPDIEDPAAFAKFAQDLFNPILDFGKFDRADHAFRLTSFGLQQDKVVGNGCLLLVPKNQIAGATKPTK
jgi:LmeA-like phospholipid-binding